MNAYEEGFPQEHDIEEPKFIQYCVRGKRHGEDVEIMCDSAEHQADMLAELTLSEPDGAWTPGEIEEDVEV